MYTTTKLYTRQGFTCIKNANLNVFKLPVLEKYPVGKSFQTGLDLNYLNNTQ